MIDLYVFGSCYLVFAVLNFIALWFTLDHPDGADYFLASVFAVIWPVSITVALLIRIYNVRA